ncbi:MAG: DinB family protein [Candidatus Hodarchaeales archaeon]
MNLKTFLKKYKYHRGRWDSLIDLIIDKRLHEEIVKENWSLKDVIAHITWYEKELVNALKEKTIVESKFWNLSIKERNELIFINTHEKTLEEILSNSKEIFNSLITEIEKLTDIELNSDNFIKRKSDKRITYDFISGNGFYHYDDHEDILIERFDLEY